MLTEAGLALPSSKRCPAMLQHMCTTHQSLTGMPWHPIFTHIGLINTSAVVRIASMPGRGPVWGRCQGFMVQGIMCGSLKAHNKLVCIVAGMRTFWQRRQALPSPVC